MNIKRRNFIQGGAAACTLLMSGIASAAKGFGENDVPAGTDTDPRIEKSIKAGFGGGFSLRNHTKTDGLTYANIEHSGNRYTVASADLVDWKVVSLR